MDFWSNPLASVTLTTTPTTLTGADIEVTLPIGVDVVYVYRILKIGRIVNTSGSANGLDGASVPDTSQVIQVYNGDAYHDSINLSNNQLSIAGSSERGYIEIFGNINMAQYINVSGTYTTRWLLSKALQDNLVLYDMELGLSFYFR